MRLFKKNTVLLLQLGAAGAISWLLLVKHLALTVAAACRTAKTSFLVADEVLNPASCLDQEHLGRPEPDQARQRSQSSISTKVCPFKNIQNPGTQTPTLHKMKARENASRDYPFSLHKETIVCLYTPSLPSFAILYSITNKGKKESNLAKTLFVSWKCNRDESCNGLW